MVLVENIDLLDFLKDYLSKAKETFYFKVYKTNLTQ